MAAVYEAKKVFYSYPGGVAALAGTDMTVEKGSRAVILGANGTGKSTLLQLFDGLIFPDSGELRVFGEPLTEKSFEDAVFSRQFRKRVGFVFQNPDVQLFCPTVREDILFGPLQLGMSEPETQARLDVIARFLGIEKLLDRSCHQLSIGEKRKVAIATTLIIEPEVLLLDEPTAGLDPATTAHIIEMIQDASASGKTVITATHDLHLVEEIADTIFVFGADKRIVRSGPAHEVLRDADFLQKHNLTHAHRHHHDGTVHTHPHDHFEHHHP